MGRIAVTGSVAFDTIMEFGGRFGDHILPDKTNELNIAFLVDRVEKRRGGTATNICFSMALFGEAPLLCAAVGGGDFVEYAAALEFEGVDMSAVLKCDDVGTATAFITTDRDGNQITAFYPGAMARAAGVDLGGLRDISEVIVGADDAGAIALHIDQAKALGARLLFAPAQQIPAMSDVVLRRGLEQAWIVAGNDYEFEMIRDRTGLSVDDLSASRIVAVTHGARGSELRSPDGVSIIPVAAVAEMRRSHRCRRCLCRRPAHGFPSRGRGGCRRPHGRAVAPRTSSSRTDRSASLRYDRIPRSVSDGVRCRSLTSVQRAGRTVIWHGRSGHRQRGADAGRHLRRCVRGCSRNTTWHPLPLRRRCAARVSIPSTRS